MKCEWKSILAKDFIEFNPKITLKKGTIAKKVAMDKVLPYTKYINEFEYANYTGGSKFQNGDTIMARITPCLENGKTAFVDFLDENEIGFGSTEFIVLRERKGISDAQYIYYLSISPQFRKIAISSMVGSSGRQRVQQSVLDELELFVPDINEQRKIANILNKIDEKIRINNRINDNLEKQAKTIFEKCFPDINNGSDIIGKVIVPKRGKTLLSKNALLGDIPVIAGGIEPTIYHNIANTIPPVITISASGANAGYVNLWNRPVWSSDSSFIDSSMTKNVYFWYILLKNKQKEIFESQTGSAQPHIYPKHIAELKVNIPAKKSIQEFSLIITPFFEHISKNLFENDKLSNIRNAILPKLISGNIDISNI